MPVNWPMNVFHFRDLKNEPCPASWKMMNMRIANPAAKGAISSVTTYDTSRLRYIRYHRMKNGAMLFRHCHKLVRRSDCWKGATACLQELLVKSGAWVAGAELIELSFFISRCI